MKSRLVVILVASFAFVLAGGCTDSATSHDGPNDKVAIIGDSLTYQGGAGEARITDLIREKGHGGGGIYFWGVGGKRLTVNDSAGASTLENIAAAQAQLGHVDTWVIALGTNDRNSTSAVVRASVNEILTALGDDHFVWVGLGFYDRDNAHADRLNAILGNAIAATPNGTLADWDTFVHQPYRARMTGLWTYPHDNIHMTQKGYRIRSRFYARAIN